MKSKKLFKDNKRKSCIQCDFSVELSVAKYKKLKRWLHLYRGFKITKETILKILEENISYKGKYEYEANKIKTVMAVTHTDLGTLKLSDVVKRLLSETD